MVGSDYTPSTPDYSSLTPEERDYLDYTNEQATDEERRQLTDPSQQPGSKSWLQKLAQAVAGYAPPQQTQGAGADAAPPTANAGAGYKPGPKGAAWSTTDPGAVGKGERAQRQAGAEHDLAHSVGVLIRMAATYGAGGGFGGGGGAASGADLAGTGAASAAGGGGSSLASMAADYFGGGDTGGGGGGFSDMFGGGGEGGGGMNISQYMKL